jgi:hypothetical protein
MMNDSKWDDSAFFCGGALSPEPNYRRLSLAASLIKRGKFKRNFLETYIPVENYLY